jgi:hypothetical protein
MAAPVTSFPACDASHTIRLATEPGCTHCDGLPAGKTADQMGQHVNPSAARDHAGDGFLCRVQTGERDRERNEVWLVEVGRLDSRGKAEHCEARIQ